jgi:NADPH-dependent 2,4-dienoyl-CoA reductase/sulfur reductase-like enzyme/rhodanese-related sulfurtransferase
MSTRRYLIVGGVAAGTSAAAKARRCDESAEILLFEKGPHISYAGCGLPYYLGRVIPEREKLLVISPEAFQVRNRVQLFLNHEAIALHPQEKTLVVRDLADGQEKTYPYDQLVLATGAVPLIPPLPGRELNHVYALRTVTDMDWIDRCLSQFHPRRAVVIGAGLIGLEMVEAFLACGLEVTVVEKLPQVLPPFDAEMAALVEKHLRDKGVRLLLGDGVARFTGEGGDLRAVETEKGETVPADVALLAIGIRPNVQLAAEAGLALGASRAIAVNAYLQTSDPDIYAAGDCAESVHLVTGQKTWLPLGSVANKQGRIAGANIAGRREVFKGVLGTTIVKVCDLAVAKTGLNEREARAHGFEVATAYLHPDDHAHYFPGALPVRLKMVVDRSDGRLLGAQAIGIDGVDKRIDVLATALYNRMSAEELFQLDLAYAPPFAPARDPVNVAGAIVQDIWRGDVQVVSPGELEQWLQQESRPFLLDVRNPDEWERGHLPGAVLIPLPRLRERLAEVPKDREVVTYCGVGLRGYLASRILLQSGHSRVFNLSGGLASWTGETVQE